MPTQLASLGASDWFMAGALLLVLELLAPGVFMAWLGTAALTVGAISLYVNWTWKAQFIAFALCSVVAVPLWLRLTMRVEEKTDQPFLNRRAEAFVGRNFTLEKPIVNGSGTIAIDDTVWRITGTDMPAGSRVQVTRVDGTALRIKLVSDSLGRVPSAGE
jgi:membrane protein implicated in regulation of membrane protease activity